MSLSTQQVPNAVTGKNATASTPSTTKNKTAAKAKPSQKPKPAPAQSKQDRVVAMLRRKDGATVAAVMKATGWQKHSVHGFFAGVVRKKLGLNLVFEESSGKRVYRIADGKRSKGAGKSRRKQAR